MAAFAQLNLRPDHTVGADLAGRGNFRGGINDCSGMNQGKTWRRGPRSNGTFSLPTFRHTGVYSDSSASADAPAPSDPPRPRAVSTSWQLTTASATRLTPT